MITSISHALNKVYLPHYTGRVQMLPFSLDDLSNLPEKFTQAVERMLIMIPKLTGEAFLTVDGRTLEKGDILRRPGPHIDGNYTREGKWDDNSGGWKGYQQNTGGLLLASNYSACMGWNGKFGETPGAGGDCSHLELRNGFLLEKDRTYYGNSQFVHESLPVEENIFRVIFRITLPKHIPLLKF